MGNLMKKHWLAFLIVGTVVATAFAAATKFTDLTVTGTLTSVTHSNTGNATVGGNLTVTGNETVTGVITTSANTPYAIKISSKTALVPSGTPSAAGLIAFDSTYVMYVSTGTGAGAWVKVGGQ